MIGIVVGLGLFGLTIGVIGGLIYNQIQLRKWRREQVEKQGRYRAEKKGWYTTWHRH